MAKPGEREYKRDIVAPELIRPNQEATFLDWTIGWGLQSKARGFLPTLKATWPPKVMNPQLRLRQPMSSKPTTFTQTNVRTNQL